MSQTQDIQVDVVVIGGGIAALWTTHALRNAGYRSLLLSNSDFGVGQTLAAQGVIHGGLKYAIGGKLTDSSEALAEMPGRWQACLDGSGEIDLSGVEILSPDQILWSLPQVMSRVVAFFGSQALKTRAQPLARASFPPPFDTPDYRGQLFGLQEMVVDPVSLVRVMATPLQAVSWKIDWDRNAAFEMGDDSRIDCVRLTGENGKGIRLRARRWIFAAGAGNADLLRQTSREAPRMQLRPLHQVVVRSNGLPPLFSVCIGTSPKPPLVTTTHRDSEGRRLWYVGGDLAETGVDRNEADQIDFARKRFGELMPWQDLSSADWATVRVNRAEPLTHTGDRPAGAFCATDGEIVTAWPTKLALAPDLASQVLDGLVRDGIDPAPQTGDASDGSFPDLDLPHPGTGTAPWNF